MYNFFFKQPLSIFLPFLLIIWNISLLNERFKKLNLLPHNPCINFIIHLPNSVKPTFSTPTFPFTSLRIRSRLRDRLVQHGPDPVSRRHPHEPLVRGVVHGGVRLHPRPARRGGSSRLTSPQEPTSTQTTAGRRDCSDVHAPVTGHGGETGTNCEVRI